jgi:hypothetical protein
LPPQQDCDHAGPIAPTCFKIKIGGFLELLHAAHLLAQPLAPMPVYPFLLAGFRKRVLLDILVMSSC